MSSSEALSNPLPEVGRDREGMTSEARNSLKVEIIADVIIPNSPYSGGG